MNISELTEEEVGIIKNYRNRLVRENLCNDLTSHILAVTNSYRQWQIKWGKVTSYSTFEEFGYQREFNVPKRVVYNAVLFTIVAANDKAEKILEQHPDLVP